MKNDKPKDMWIYLILVLALGLVSVMSPEGLAVSVLAGSFIAGVMTLRTSTVSESPAEFLVITYIYR